MIAGTGRAGTTVLVQLLDACGLETGKKQLRFNQTARAGLETQLFADGSPYVVKSPYLSENLDDLLANGFDPKRIDAIILPLRDLDDAVASRIKVFVKHGNPTPGGLWRAKRPGLQRRILAESVHQLLMTAADYRIPIFLVAFPRFVNDAQYTWECLKAVLPDVDETTFLQKHEELFRTELVSTLPHVGRMRMALFDCLWLIRKMSFGVRATVSRRHSPVSDQGPRDHVDKQELSSVKRSAG